MMSTLPFIQIRILNINHEKLRCYDTPEGPQPWPSPETCGDDFDCAAFQTTMQQYFEQAGSVGFRLVQLLALAIGVDEHYFDEAFQDPMAVLRLLHYAKEESHPEDGVYACGAHSDYGMITLLLTDENPGLQILTKDNEWIDVPPRPEAFVVNLGDMLERWTNGLFRSTKHRVLTSAESERYSIPFFYEPAFDTEVTCLDVCCSEDNPPKWKPTTSGQHLLDKYKQTHADFEPGE
jgi:isopenicillin N synthase-like dioxygenase